MQQQDGIKQRLKRIDWILVTLVLAASVYGLVMVHSAALITGSMRSVLVQIGAIGIGLICAAVISQVDYDHIVKYAKYIYIAAFAMLTATLFFGVGEAEGSKSWLIVPFVDISVQPSEVVKVLFVVTFAKHLDIVKTELNKVRNVVFIILHAGMLIGLVLLQGDLGTTLVYIFIFIAMLFSAGLSYWYILGGFASIAAAAPFVWANLKEYQKMRIIVVFNPEASEKYSYHAKISKEMIGSGGITGQGYMSGAITQRTLGSKILPVQDSDFIFAVIGEELGFIGTTAVLVLLTLIILHLFRMSRRARNDIGSLICVGIAAMFMAQTIENIGMCLGILPVVGITLPFFSAGGSSIVASFMAIGVVLGVNSRRNIYFFNFSEE